MNSVGGTYSIAILDKDMVVAAYGNKEEYDVDIIEDVNPFLALRPLPTDIEHAIRETTSFEDGFTDTGRS